MDLLNINSTSAFFIFIKFLVIYNRNQSCPNSTPQFYYPQFINMKRPCNPFVDMHVISIEDGYTLFPVTRSTCFHAFNSKLVTTGFCLTVELAESCFLALAELANAAL